MADKLSWRGLVVGWALVFLLVLVIAGVYLFLHSDAGSTVFHTILGLFLVAYEAVHDSIRSVASSVGGGGVLAALVLAFIALFVAHHAEDKADEEDW